MNALREILSGRNDRLSSKRLFMLLIVLATVVDWMHAVWTVGIWRPDASVLIFIGSFFGISVGGSLTEPKVKNEAPSSPKP